MAKSVNLLIPAAGAATYLCQRIRQEANTTGGQLILTDLSPEPPAKAYADIFYTTPRLSDPAFEPKILEIIQKHRIGAILPKRQQEFLWWSEFIGRHPQVQLMLSSAQALKICVDKKSSYGWLRQNNFPVAPYAMKTDGDMTTLQKTLGPLPWFAKPFDGSGTRGVAKVTSAQEFDQLSSEMLLQPMLQGVEYTINLYVNRAGQCIIVIPHRRIEVKDGEVTTGITVNEPYLIELAHALAKKLPGLYGPMCFQVFHDEGKGSMSAQSVVITDINPRFGGGYPLCEAAGGNFAQWLVLEAMGQPLPANAGQWTPGVRMERPDGRVEIMQPANAR